jgi:peroxiredoxin
MRSILKFKRAAFLLLAVCVLGLSAGEARAEALTGQIVCSQCWFEADRDATAYGSTEDLACALRCDAKGVGSSIAVRGADGFKLYPLKGSPPEGGSWVEWAGRFVQAEGVIDSGKGKDRFRAKSLEILADNPWPTRLQKGPAHRDAADAPDPHDHDDEGGHDDHSDAEHNDDEGIVWTDLRGEPAYLDDYKEQIVVINFWATWCLPCKKEMPDLIDLHDQFAPYRVEFVGASVDAPDQAEAVLNFVRRHKINFPIVLGATTTQMESLGLPPALPATVVIDEHGHTVDWFPGVIDPDAVEASLSNLLGLTDAGPPGKPSRVARGRPDTHGHQSHASLVPS